MTFLTARGNIGCTFRRTYSQGLCVIIDLQLQQPETRDITADVCIVGAGPAGITLALELARTRPDWHIVLTEAGGPDNATDQEKDIYKAELGEKNYSVLEFSRRRKLGGTTAHWGGWSKPLDDTDYEDNLSWDVPAWPFGPAELAPYMASALEWLEIEGSEFDFSRLRDQYLDYLLPTGPDTRLGKQLFRFSPPTRFGERYIYDLAAQDNLTCLLHANLFDLERQGDVIRAARVRPLEGDTVIVHATQFVLAMGGMESTRYLLNLRDERPTDGVGIYSDHLGRYFADHYGARPGSVLAPEELKYHRFSGTDGKGPLMPVLTFSPAEIRTNQQHNACMMLSAESAEKSVLQNYGGSSAVGFKPGNYWQYRVQMIVEPRPNPASRITLTDERCALGLRRMKLDWQPHESDYQSAYELYRAFGDELDRTGLGRQQLSRENTAEVRSQVNGACHHLGATRMAANESDGVVDTNLKVYGSDNLYVASSSVFPRYGHSNPTLTIVALSVRLAQHLAKP